MSKRTPFRPILVCVTLVLALLLAVVGLASLTPATASEMTLIYDDFAIDGVLDPAVWNFTSNSTGAHWEVQDNILMIHGGTTYGGGGTVRSNQLFQPGNDMLVVEIKARLGTPDYASWFGLAPVSSSCGAAGFAAYHPWEGNYGDLAPLQVGSGYMPCGCVYTRIEDVDPTAWHTYRAEVEAGNAVRFYVDGQMEVTNTQCVPQFIDMYVRLDQSSLGQDEVLYIDYARLTRVTTPPPSPTPPPPTCPPAFPDDTHAPVGAIHAHDNMIWPPNGKLVTVTLDGHVVDELSIARDGGGIGVSSAHIVIDGQTIVLKDVTVNLLGEDGSFSIETQVRATKGAMYTVELYASDTEPPAAGGPNSGLVDSTYIRVPKNLGGGSGN